jgi:D-citramalate synthase
MRVEIMDTTLRDGEQTSGVAYTAAEKLNLAKILLDEVKVDRIEIASARISDGERDAVKRITEWASKKGILNKIEILGFVDGGKSLDWIHQAGGKVINLLTKGSLNHLEGQLKKTPDEHITEIKNSLKIAEELGIETNIYLEDWSNGMTNSKDYVFYLLDHLKDTSIKRFMLPDTLGILNPDTITSYLKETKEKYPNLHFDSHLHNDYDLAVGNTFAAIKGNIDGLHCTVNGLGERTGNTPLASIIGLQDHLDFETNVDEKTLNHVSRMVEVFSGISTPQNKPLVGDYVFTQACGVHADGDEKGDLYRNKLAPERFGRRMEYALGKTSGKASVKKNLEDLGIVLSPENMAKVTQRVVELGDKKESITKDDLPYIISDVIGSDVAIEKVKLLNYYSTHVYNLKPVTTVKIEIEGKIFEETATGDGQYDAFMKAVTTIYTSFEKKLPLLKNYKITIPPGGRTDALVETIITWENEKGTEFKTRGLESDQQAAAIMATIKMLNKV